MQIKGLPIQSLTSMTAETQLQHILDVRQRRRFVAKKLAQAKVAVPKFDGLSQEQLQKLATLLGIEV